MHHCLNLPHEGSTHTILAIGGQVNKKQGHPDPFDFNRKNEGEFSAENGTYSFRKDLADVKIISV